MKNEIPDEDDFYKTLSQAPVEERLIIFRHEALRWLLMALPSAELIQEEIVESDCPELSDDITKLCNWLVKSLREMQRLVDALIDDHPAEAENE